MLVYTALDPETDRGGPLDAILVAATAWGRGWAASHAPASKLSGLTRAILRAATRRATRWANSDVLALTTRFPLAATPRLAAVYRRKQ